MAKSGWPIPGEARMGGWQSKSYYLTGEIPLVATSPELPAGSPKPRSVLHSAQCCGGDRMTGLEQQMHRGSQLGGGGGQEQRCWRRKYEIRRREGTRHPGVGLELVMEEARPRLSYRCLTQLLWPLGQRSAKASLGRTEGLKIRFRQNIGHHHLDKVALPRGKVAKISQC